MLSTVFAATLSLAMVDPAGGVVQKDEPAPEPTVAECISHYSVLPAVVRDLLGLEYLLNCLQFTSE